jgi:hypothetical protein
MNKMESEDEYEEEIIDPKNLMILDESYDEEYDPTEEGFFI